MNENQFNPEFKREIQEQGPITHELERVFGEITLGGITTIQSPATIYSTLPWNKANLEKRQQIGSENRVIVEKIKELLKTLILPKSYHVDSNLGAYANKQHQFDLFYLGSVLLKRKMDSEKIETDLKEAFSGKRILVLGDDIGTLSETINRLGGSAFGIEYDEELVETAHSGKFAEDGTPQTQVIHGNISALTDKDSELFKKLKDLGPFDAVYSHAVFNTGSGIDKAERAYSAKAKELSFLGKVLDNTDSLLNELGFQVHTSTEFSHYGIFDQDTHIDDEKTKALLIENGGPVLLGMESHVNEAFISRKGLVNKLVETKPFKS